MASFAQSEMAVESQILSKFGISISDTGKFTDKGPRDINVKYEASPCILQSITYQNKHDNTTVVEQIETNTRTICGVVFDVHIVRNYKLTRIKTDVSNSYTIKCTDITKSFAFVVRQPDDQTISLNDFYGAVSHGVETFYETHPNVPKISESEINKLWARVKDVSTSTQIVQSGCANPSPGQSTWQNKSLQPKLCENQAQETRKLENMRRNLDEYIAEIHNVFNTKPCFRV